MLIILICLFQYYSYMIFSDLFFLLSLHLFSYSFFLPFPLNVNSFLFFDILVKTEFFLKVLLLDITHGF